ncbi:hypothetical protein G7Y31_06770 [Corynebacterium lizhenjunii]|uniref:Transferase n=1 Tax=Corynebacterium lizhenjunii TaxID=2709394 RepID=A0A7T0PB86_9CORY|nr:hypothetical protein [Corynebacterium lizhenjunii]QPK78287.1 hypothetical protein G7Y31_06770 [Corynebacterium lizhenjunii]
MSNHFTLTDDTITTLSGVTLYRIQATKDLPHHGVKAGDLGGYIQSADNLQDRAWVADEARVSGDACVFSDARVAGGALVSGNALVYGDARVYGYAQVFSNAHVYGDAHVAGDARVYGFAQVSGNARVTGNAQVSNSACIRGKAQVSTMRHLLTIGTIGSENHTLTATPTHTGGTQITIGCWTGTLEAMMDEVHYRAKHWHKDPETTTQWIAEYQAAHTLITTRAQQWAKEANETN